MLTLEEIENISFRRSGLSGYKTDDVDNFVDNVIDKVKDLEIANKELELRIAQLNLKLQRHEENASSVQDAIITAEITAKKLVRDAEEKAEKITTEAEEKAQARLKDAEERFESMLSEAKIRSDTILNSALVKSAANIDENNRIIEQQKQHIIQIQSEVSRFREALLDSYKSHLKVINSLPKAEEFKQYQTKLEESYPTVKPATPQSVEQELRDEADRAVEAAKNDKREIRVEKRDEEKIKEISDDIRFNTRGQAAIKEDELKAEAARLAEEEKKSDEEKKTEEAAKTEEPVELSDLDAVITEDGPEEDKLFESIAEAEKEKTEEPANNEEKAQDNKPAQQKTAAETARSSYAIVHGKKKGKKGKKGKGSPRRPDAVSDRNEDSNAKDIEAASNSERNTMPKDEPKPMSIDELDDGVIFNSGRNEGSTTKREPIRISGDIKTKGFDFTDID